MALSYTNLLVQYPACGTQQRMWYPAQHRNKRGDFEVKFGKNIFSFKFIFLHISFFLSFPFKPTTSMVDVATIKV